MPEYSQRSELTDLSSNLLGPFDYGVFADLNKQIDRLFSDTAISDEAGRMTKMLVKYPEFRIVLVTMKLGSRWNDHKTPARIFVQVLRGQVHFHTPGSIFELSSGQLLTLDPGIVHSVDAVQDSAFLLTLADAASP